MALARFLPRDQRFYSHFADAAENAVAAARLLTAILDGGPDMERHVRRLRELEHEGDEITHRIFQALNRTFVTPLDRDDIQALASRIDDFVDDLEEVGKRFWLYRIDNATEPARLFVRILAEQAETLHRGLPLLEHAARGASELKRCVLRLHQLENEADDALHAVLATLYDDAADIPSLITSLRWGELYGLLEDATDQGEAIGNTLEGILLKHA